MPGPALAEPRAMPRPALPGLRHVPDPAPPYDDDVDKARAAGLLDRRGAGLPDQHGRGATADRTRQALAGLGTDDTAGPRRGDPGPPAARPPGSGGRAAPWQSQFAQILAETLAGWRPPRQLHPWTTERARGHIRRLGPLLAASQEPRIRRIVASTPSSDVMELAVVAHFGQRIRALAIRLERSDTAWQCTAVEAA